MKVRIEFNIDPQQSKDTSVQLVDDYGKLSDFGTAPGTNVAAPIDTEHPPKFLDAMAITYVRTNPCAWVLIGGVWRWKCW